MKSRLIATWRWAACALLVLLVLTPSVDSAPNEAKDHWAFQPLRSVQPPSVKGNAVSPVDRFILAGLQGRSLTLSPPASREQLIRRVSLDLIGLPPTLNEIDNFVTDRSPEAYAKVIDRLLASPHYGERWARHWLDLVRYAESDGFEHDAIRPHSWRYRDYVIQSFNGDKPYDRFVQEQIAGDELWPDEPDALAATAFNLLGPDMVDSADQTQRRLLTLSDMTDTTAFAFLGITMSCARCHHHKSEPFSQQDYYSLQAFFAPASFERELAVPTPSERRRHADEMKLYRARTDSTQSELDAIEKPVRERLFQEKLAGLSEDAQLAHRTTKDQRTMEQEGTVQETAPQLKITDAELSEQFTSSERARRDELRRELKKIPKPAALPMTMALRNTNGPAPKTFVLGRGDYNNPLEEVRPGFPAVLNAGRQVPQSKAESGPRTTLANWLTDPRHPLTARVMVNRIWQHHFGRGIVRTPSNFGTQGTAPSHPELLDWLAAEFQRGDWSIKVLHKLILLSSAYQQSSEASSKALSLDPNNDLFSRQNRVRLEGEVIRDSLLFISGRLNPRMGGPSVFPPVPADIIKTSKNWTTSVDPEDHRRRSVYIFARRNLRFPFLEVFDSPDSNLSCPERGQSTTAPQSLTLLNADEVIEAAAAVADRLVRGAQIEKDRIDLAFRLILGRDANEKERRMAGEFLQNCRSRQKQTPSGNSTPGPSPAKTVNSSAPRANEDWRELCRALFNLNAFVYVD